MIRYALKCPAHHVFESWFQSAGAFDGQVAAGQLTCPFCASTQIKKSLMAPAVRPARKAAGTPTVPDAEPPKPQTPDLSTPAGELERALLALRRQVEENSDYVGMNFVSEARAMHDGDMPERPIYGEARPEEARRLIEDDVPVAPLPFMPVRRVN